MDWLKRMNAALDYVENNLANEIDMSVVAQKACCTSYNFQKMFSYITGITLNEYIRRRKLTLAAFDIHNSNIKVIDIALKYGYESPISFTRAFHAMHGITPSLARNYHCSKSTLQKRFYSEWLPTSNYEKIDSAEFEIYGGNEEYGYIELWYPVIKTSTDEHTP